MRTTIALILLATACTRDVGGDVGDGNTSAVDGGGGDSDTSDAANASADLAGSQIDMAGVSPQDLATVASPDLSCVAWYDTGATSDVFCTPGTADQRTQTSPTTCYRQFCGCKNASACTYCVWSSWLQAACN